MKKTLLIAACAASFSAYALPTYEPFTEFNSTIASSGTNMFAITNANGGPLGANANGSVASCLDLATGGYSAPGGEQWISLNFGPTLTYGGLDVALINNSNIFSSAALSSLLPSKFPGYPSGLGGIPTIVENPAQPSIWNGSSYVVSASIVGNSAVFKFANDTVRPASGVKTLYVSYLLSVQQLGQLGAGNDGRYLAFLSSSNLVEGAGTAGSYPTFASLFNTYGTGANPEYCGHGLLEKSATVAYVLPCDSSAPKDSSGTTFTMALGASGGASGAPVFIVGCYTFVAGAADTNTVWVNPATSAFGGSQPPSTPIYNQTMEFNMSDIGGLCLIDRPGSGASGGVGTNYLANLIIGASWSYVTGGPEFLSQPVATNAVTVYGTTISLGGSAVAAGQSVAYAWQKVAANSTNTLTDGTGSAGGAAIVAGSGTTNLTLTGISAGDMGTYQLLTTASGTGYTLTSARSVVVYVSDPFINPQPNPLTVNKGATATFSATATTATSSMTYQWYLGSTPVVNGTLPDGCTVSGASGGPTGASFSTTLTLTGVTYQERGAYTLWVTNSASAVTSGSAVLTVNDPYIVTQPTGFTNSVGSSNTISCAASGSGTLSYQWYNTSGPLAVGGDISSVTKASLTFSSLQLADAGTFYVKVTGSGGTAQSSSVTVSPQPIITEPPNSVVVAQGASTNISVGTAGSGVTYQWYSTNNGALTQLYNTGDFSGVTTTNLVLTNAAYTDSGNYVLVATWPNGSEASTVVDIFVQVSAYGPFPATNWPVTADSSAQVTYTIFDPNSASDTPNFVAPANWVNNLTLTANSGDQSYTAGNTYAGLEGDAMTGTYLNIVDPTWHRFATYPIIDVLLQVWGNGAFNTSTNTGLTYEWTEGQLWQGPHYSKNYTYPVNINNGQWNWVLLEITNPVDSTVDASPYVIPGAHLVGDTGNPPQSSSGGASGGINNGTLRMDGFGSGFTVRAIALGPQGAFGTPAEINRFAPPPNCAPEPGNNLAWVDFNQGTANNLEPNPNASFETYITQSGVGPANDQRTAIQPTSSFMEFAILNDYLGQPCNEDLTMQVCVEFYDDPNLTGEQFGPYAYASDYYGDVNYVPGYPNNYNQAFYTLTGTGQWLKVDWFVGPANLVGYSTAPLTGGPLLFFGGDGTALPFSPPFIDRVELGVIRTGTNALAGQIPDSSYNIDPFICSTNNNTNGYYAEWNPTAGVENNLTIAASYGTATAGPANDRRLAEVPSPAPGGGAYYEQFLLENNAFGPVLQDNSDVAMTVTYYDDPALASNELFVNIITTMQNGSLGAVSPAGTNTYVILQGTGKWVDANFEITGVNFSPTTFSAPPSFVCRYASYNPIYISRVRYNVIRPCGQYEGIDYLQGNVNIARTNSEVNLGWRGTATLLSAPVAPGPYVSIVSLTNDVINAYPVAITNTAQFFKLQFPSYPTNLSPYTPSP